MVIQQNMSFVTEGYASLGEKLKGRAVELRSSVQEVKDAQEETNNMLTWLRDMKKTAASWNSAATEKDSVKTQLEQQRVQTSCYVLNCLNHYCELYTQSFSDFVLP